MTSPADWTPAQIEAAARAWSGAPYPSKASLTKARAALTAAAEVQPEPCCAHPKCPGGSICCCQQPAPEADERVRAAVRRALAGVVLTLEWDAIGWDVLTDDVMAAIRRSQPAPRTVSAEQRDALARAISPNVFDPDEFVVTEDVRAKMQAEAFRQADWFIDYVLAALGITVEAPDETPDYDGPWGGR